MVRVSAYRRPNWTNLKVRYYAKWVPARYSFEAYVVGGPKWDEEAKKFPDRFWHGTKGLMLHEDWVDHYVVERPDLIKGEPKVLSEAESIQQLVKDIAGDAKMEICHKTEGGFFVDFEPQDKPAKYVPAPDVHDALFKGLREADRTILDFDMSPIDKQMSILSRLAGREVHGWKLEPSWVVKSATCPGCSICRAEGSDK